MGWPSIATPSLSLTPGCRQESPLSHRTVPWNQAESYRVSLASKRASLDIPTPLQRTSALDTGADLPLIGSPSPATSQLPAPIVGPDATRQAVFTDITEIRTTVDLLRSRIQGLEGLLANALNQPPAAATVAAQPHVSQQRQQPNHFEYIQPARPQYPQDPLPFLAPNEPCSAPQGFRPIDGTAAPIHDHHTSGVTSNRVDATMDGGRQAEEELEASVALEFLALGRHRTFGVTSTANTLDEGQKLPDGAQSIGQRQNGVHNSATPATYSQRLNGHASPSHHTAPPTSYPTLPYAIFPTAASLADCLPPQQQGSIILTHSLEQLAWHHGAVHAPSFSREVEEFWSWSSSGEKRVEVCNPAWLALFFAMLVVGVGNLAPGMAEVLGLTEGKLRSFFLCYRITSITLQPRCRLPRLIADPRRPLRIRRRPIPICQAMVRRLDGSALPLQLHPESHHLLHPGHHRARRLGAGRCVSSASARLLLLDVY